MTEDEMDDLMAALEKDGEKLKALTGEDHGPFTVVAGEDHGRFTGEDNSTDAQAIGRFLIGIIESDSGYPVGGLGGWGGDGNDFVDTIAPTEGDHTRLRLVTELGHVFTVTIAEDADGAKHMTREQFLVVLIEECGEVIQAATKCLRFGWDRDQPNYGINHEVLAFELGDLLGVADALNLRQDLVDNSRKTKMTRVLHAHATFGDVKCQNCGQVIGPGPPRKMT
jgi:hypothetical protein